MSAVARQHVSAAVKADQSSFQPYRSECEQAVKLVRRHRPRRGGRVRGGVSGQRTHKHPSALSNLIDPFSSHTLVSPHLHARDHHSNALALAQVVPKQAHICTPMCLVIAYMSHISTNNYSLRIISPFNNNTNTRLNQVFLFCVAHKLCLHVVACR